MRKNYLLILLVCTSIVLVTSCLDQTETAERTEAETQPTITSQTLTPVPASLLPTDTPKAVTTEPPIRNTPTISTVSATPTDSAFTIRGVNVIDSFPYRDWSSGSLVLGGEFSKILHFIDPLQEEPIGENACLDTSPDGRWFSYCVNADQLMVESADRGQKFTTPLDPTLSTEHRPHIWLDNRHVVFNPYRQIADFGDILTVVVVDPFASEMIELPYEYPGFTPPYCGPSPIGHFQFAGVSMVYHPSLDFVIYPETDLTQSYIVLWDRQTDRALAKIEESICFGNYPLWSPNAQQFIVAVNMSEERKVEDLVQVTLRGDQERLTWFANTYYETDISSMNWSPGSEKMAFWMDTSPNICTSQDEFQMQLLILDVSTRNISAYCFPEEYGMASDIPPVWSLDGKYLAVKYYNLNDDINYTFVLDVKDALATIVSQENDWPVGWLAKP